MDLGDRLTRGFVAGAAGSIIQNALDIAFRLIFLIDKKLYLDWTAVLIYGNSANHTLEFIFALLSHLIFNGFLGIAFAFLILKTTARNYLFKGWLFAVFMWFSFEAIALLFNVEPLLKDNFNAALLTFTSASVFGLVLAKALQWLDKIAKA